MGKKRNDKKGASYKPTFNKDYQKDKVLEQPPKR